MADLADKAQDEQEILDKLYLGVRKPVLHPRGLCHWCDEQVYDGALFCSIFFLPPGDRGCAGEWENEQLARARAGVSHR